MMYPHTTIIRRITSTLRLLRPGHGDRGLRRGGPGRTTAAATRGAAARRAAAAFTPGTKLRALFAILGTQ